MNYSVRGFNMLAIATAVVMVIVGISELFFRVGRFDPEHINTLLRVFPPLCTLTAGIILFHPRMRNAVKAVGMVAIGLAVGRIFVSLYFIYNNLGTDSIIPVIGLSESMVLKIYGYVLLILAVYQLYVGSYYVRNEAHFAFTMRFTAALTIIMYLLALIYINRYIIPATEMWNIYRDLITTPILYTMYFVMLCSKEVFDAMPEEVLRRDIEDMGGRHEPGRLYADPETIEGFVSSFRDRGSWREPEYDCPVERELSLPARGDFYGYEILCQIWRGSDRVHVTLVPDGGRSYVSAVRFEASSVDFDGEFLTINDSVGPRIRVDCSAARSSEIENTDVTEEAAQ